MWHNVINFRSNYLRFKLLYSEFMWNLSLIFLLNYVASGSDIPNLSFGSKRYKIKENQPPGLVVANLKDEILFRNLFASSRYHFVLQKESEEYFSIKPGSNMLTTNKLIDLESICISNCPNGSKEFELIANFREGKQFIQEVKISILVEDVNDNDPYFQESSYQKAIKEIIYGPGKIIDLPRAYDKDIALINNQINYTLIEPSSFFYLQITNDGKPRLKILKELDAESQDTHKLVLLAWNPNYPSKPSCSLTITIFVEDINDNEPMFNETTYKVPISENVELNHKIVQLKATDRDKTSKLRFLVESELNDEITKTFNISDQGIIFLIKNLDYETIKQYTITVRVTDGEFSSKGRVEVIIIDVNDCAPQFTLNPETLAIPENTPKRTLLGHMNVIDQDSSYVDLGIECREKSEDQVMKFEMVENTNDRTKKINIYLNQNVDRDIMNGERRFSVIICNDLGLNNRLTSTFTITLTVLDVNDNKPNFTSDIYKVSVKENSRPRYSLLKVEATDRDAGVNSQIRYFLSDQNNQQLFQIDEHSGHLVGLQSLDREKQDFYEITVLATDSAINEQRHTAMATVQIFVLDVNDCVPKINESYTTFSVYENRPVGTIIGTIQASDCDLGQNGNFIFSLIPSAISHYFELMSNGSLSTKVSFDREMSNQVKFCLMVTVRDTGENLHLSSKTTVCVTILDENDNPPNIIIIPEFVAANNYSEYNSANCSITVSKFEPANSQVFPFTYTDLDEGPNSHVTLSITVYPVSPTSNQLFVLNSTEKCIKLKRLWKSSDGVKFLITLIAKDDGFPSLETKKVIVVQFADIPARYVESSVSVSSLSNVKINVLIIIVLVTISTVLTTALIGAIVCMLQPCGNKRQRTNNGNGVLTDVNSILRIKSYPDSYMVASSIIDSADNDDIEFKPANTSQPNEYCKSEHHWTHEIDETGRSLNYFTLPSQLLAGTAITTHEEQRSDSGRGASDEDNPNYISSNDVFHYKPLYSMIPNVAYSSTGDAMIPLKPSIQMSLSNKPILSPIPMERIASNDFPVKSLADSNVSFLCTSKLPFYSISYGQNISLLQPIMTSVPEGDSNIPLTSFDSVNFSTQQQSLSSSSSSNNNNLSGNSSRIENIDDDMVNLSSHIDQLFFTKSPVRFQPFGKN